MSATKQQVLTQERVRELFTYDPDTGVLSWRDKRGTRIKAGTPAGTISCISGRNTYRVVMLDRKRRYAHRLIFLYVYGFVPDEVDHEDGNGLNNRLVNLRGVSHQGNAKNCRLSSANTSGSTGVHRLKATGTWLASITVDGKSKNLGRFKSLQEAIDRRKAAEAEYGFHINHGSERPL